LRCEYLSSLGRFTGRRHTLDCSFRELELSREDGHPHLVVPDTRWYTGLERNAVTGPRRAER
jgi:hypothetical protein